MKKFFSILLAFALIFSVCFSANACTEAVENTVKAAQTATLKAMVKSANAKVKALVRTAQATPYDDIAWLQRSVSAVTKPVFAYAAKIGATVVCDVVYYEIDGQTVGVDPLRVVNID